MAEEGGAAEGGKLHDYDFSTTDAGASLTYPSEAGQIRKGGHIVIKGHPCKVVDVSTSKTGKHGHAKCNFVATDIFTGKKYEDIVPSTHGTEVPNVKREEFTLLDIAEDGYCELMRDDGSTRNDVKLPDYPDTLAKEITDAFHKATAADGSIVVTILSSMGKEQIIAFKEDN